MMRAVIPSLLLCASLAAAAPSPAPSVDWPRFLQRQDLVWDAPPPTWDRGAFLGNGLVGAMVYEPGPGRVVWELGRSDVTDDGHEPVPLDARPRLPLGELELETAAADGTGDARLALWDAELAGKLGATPLSVRSYVHAHRPLVVIELAGRAAAGTVARFVPALAVSDRARVRRLPITDATLPPAPFTDDVAAVHVSVQIRRGGGEHAVAWADLRADGRRTILLAIENGDHVGEARARAVRAVRDAVAAGPAALRREHQAFWHAFWPQSFLSLPDAELESFYWIQMYKLASATRPGRPALDTLGPWYHRTPWPASGGT
jgi:hypothetical protein